MAQQKKIQLKRELGYFWGTDFLIINIIGAGIFVSPKGVLEYSCMNIGIALCVWIVCAILSLTNSLCFVEISVTFPCSAAHYFFLKRCYGSMASFLRVWTSIFLGPAMTAGHALMLTEYGLQPFYPSCVTPNLPKKCVALAALWMVGFLNCRGIKEMTWLQMASTVLKISILSIISLSGVFILVRGRRKNIEKLQNIFDGDIPDISQIIEAIFQGYFAFSGGGCITFIAGELKEPSKTIPKCVLMAVPLVTVVYLLADISYLTVLSPREILSSGTVAMTWTANMIPQLTRIVPFAISASLLSNIMINVIEVSRIFLIAGHLDQLPLLFKTLNIHSSPFIPVLVNVIMASFLIASASLMELINYVYFVSSIWTTLIMIGILKLRYQEPNLHRPYKVSLPFVFITIAICMCLVLIPLIKSPKMHYIYVTLFIFSGLLLYIPFTRFKLKLVWVEKLTCYLQLLFNICIPDEPDKLMLEIETYSHLDQVPNKD
ncbi:LOW QUALITY PROTEIN: solute carrier family 7 member 13 [Perognathus longimembris pacificus]|uniref:LOW QUALITY PROTEIN: solute carrier family 7 member 13 n=1 Tax=Perognathus longimembris pacificus TaxID=214514 RepID=UPI002018B9EB|nr:LOW QUALITY PROTEIN: solute carrier family 7 member 13 [Perognathus longimembris pacificus]